MVHNGCYSWSGDKFRTCQWVLTERQVWNKNNDNATLIVVTTNWTISWISCTRQEQGNPRAASNPVILFMVFFAIVLLWNWLTYLLSTHEIWRLHTIVGNCCLSVHTNVSVLSVSFFKVRLFNQKGHICTTWRIVCVIFALLNQYRTLWRGGKSAKKKPSRHDPYKNKGVRAKEAAPAAFRRLCFPAA